MSVCLLRVGDGRDAYHNRSWESAVKHLPKFDDVITVDDREHRLGFAGAIQHGWNQIKQTDHDYIFWLEMDFIFDRQVPLDAMLEVLGANRHLAQIALLRQPWNAAELAAGGIVQQYPADYQVVDWNGHRWLEHTRFFTTNPCLVPRWVIELGWPQRDQSEGHFGLALFAHPDIRAAFWGDGEPWVTHIGDTREGHGY